MGSSYWSSVCSAAVKRPIAERSSISNGLCGLLLALYCAAAIASVTRFLQFRRLSPEQRPKMWKYYGAFNALLMSASLAGAVGWASFTQNANLSGSASAALASNQTLPSTKLEQLAAAKRLVAQASSWSAAFFVLSALEFAAISLAQTLVCMPPAPAAVDS